MYFFQNNSFKIKAPIAPEIIVPLFPTLIKFKMKIDKAVYKTENIITGIIPFLLSISLKFIANKIPPNITENKIEKVQITLLEYSTGEFSSGF
jgi:hypothetical protein